MQKYLLQLILVVNWITAASGQTESEVRSSAIDAASRIASLASVALEARVDIKEDSGLTNGIVKLQQLGKEKRLSFDPSIVQVGKKPPEYFARLRKASGSSLPSIHSFDGREMFHYMPLELRLLRETALEFAGPRWAGTLFPGGWNSISGLPTVDVLLLLSKKFPVEVVRPSSPEDPWLFFREQDDEQYAFKRIEFLVDPRSGFHVTELKTSGGAFRSSITKLDWARQDGRWYPKSATIEDYRGIKINWEITKIDFEAASIIEPFTLKEERLPVGTIIHDRTTDGNGKQVIKDRFVGGEDGAIEHKLRQQAIIKVRGDYR